MRYRQCHTTFSLYIFCYTTLCLYIVTTLCLYTVTTSGYCAVNGYCGSLICTTHYYNAVSIVLFLSGNRRYVYANVYIYILHCSHIILYDTNSQFQTKSMSNLNMHMKNSTQFIFLKISLFYILHTYYINNGCNSQNKYLCYHYNAFCKCVFVLSNYYLTLLKYNKNNILKLLSCTSNIYKTHSTHLTWLGFNPDTMLLSKLFAHYECPLSKLHKTLILQRYCLIINK